MPCVRRPSISVRFGPTEEQRNGGTDPPIEQATTKCTNLHVSNFVGRKREREQEKEKKKGRKKEGGEKKKKVKKRKKNKNRKRKGRKKEEKK